MNYTHKVGGASINYRRHQVELDPAAVKVLKEAFYEGCSVGHYAKVLDHAIRKDCTDKENFSRWGTAQRLLALEERLNGTFKFDPKTKGAHLTTGERK